MVNKSAAIYNPQLRIYAHKFYNWQTSIVYDSLENCYDLDNFVWEFSQINPQTALLKYRTLWNTYNSVVLIIIVPILKELIEAFVREVSQIRSFFGD